MTDIEDDVLALDDDGIDEVIDPICPASQSRLRGLVRKNARDTPENTLES